MVTIFSLLNAVKYTASMDRDFAIMVIFVMYLVLNTLNMLMPKSKGQCEVFFNHAK